MTVFQGAEKAEPKDAKKAQEPKKAAPRKRTTKPKE